MRYCPDCGTGHECTAQAEAEDKARVAIARLETTRDIEVARINAQAGVKIGETEAGQVAARAEGQVEGMETVIEAAAGGNEPEGEPIVIEPGPAAVEEPATIEEPEIEAPPEIPETIPETNKRGGWWGAYS